MSLSRETLISVIMPCYNAEAHLALSVESVLSQTYDDLELIVVNDGSTDSSLEVLQGIEDPRLKVLNQPNQGVCRARNRGLAAARGEFIAFLDADDTWHPHCLERLLHALKSSRNAVLAYCGWQNLGLTGGRGKPYVPPDYERPDKVETLLGGCRWPIHAALTRKSAITEVGGFDERFLTSEDYLLWLRIAKKTLIVRVPEVLAFYHHHAGVRATKDRVRAARNEWLVKHEFLAENADIVSSLGRRRIRELTIGPLLNAAYQSYWARDLDSARTLFRMVMKMGYGHLRDWKYMLPCLLPPRAQWALIQRIERKRVSMT